jgi:hypothetical protein
MADGWLEVELAKLSHWHVSSLTLPSRPFGGVPVSLRVIAAPFDLFDNGRTRTPNEALFFPRMIPLCLVLASGYAAEMPSQDEQVSRLETRFRLPIAQVVVKEFSPTSDSALEVRRGFDGSSSGSGVDLARQVDEIISRLGLPIELGARRQKPLNTGRVNDPLHAWSREHLSSDLVVNDIDALCFTGRNAPIGLVEIKRSGYTPWMPYGADAKNYALSRSLALHSSGDIHDLVLHYDHTKTHPPYSIGIHSIVGTTGWLDEPAKTRTVGRLEETLQGGSSESVVQDLDEWSISWLERSYWSTN